MSAEFRKKFKETFFWSKTKINQQQQQVQIKSMGRGNSINSGIIKKQNRLGYLFKQNNKNNNNDFINNELLLVNENDKNNNINDIVKENDFCFE